MANIKRTKEDCIREILELSAQGHPLTSTTVERSLVGSCNTYFGKWSIALKEIGVVPTRKPYRHTKAIRQQRLDRTVWTDEIIIEKLNEALRNGYTSMELRKKYKGLGDSLDRRFGGIHGACKHFGLPNLERGEVDVYQRNGWKFEYLLGELFDEIGLAYEKYQHDKYRPDFVMGSHWIDAKLSEWTIHTCNTVENYEPYCEELTVVFFRGNKLVNKMITDKTRLVNVHYYIEQLPCEKRGYFYRCLDEIERELSEKEAV